MSSLKSNTIQIQFRPEQLRALRHLAARREVAIAHLVRESVDRFLEEIPVEEDPLWDIVGMIEGGPKDLSEQHDKYLSEWIAEENRA